MARTFTDAFSLTLRPATTADYDFLYHLHQVTLQEYIAQIWGWDERWERTYFKRKFDPTHRQIVLLGATAVGTITATRTSTEIFLANIGILPAYQRQGIGTRLIQALLTEAAGSGLHLTLQVLKVNPARRLYERLGFEVIAETETHYLMKAGYKSHSR